ncbi:hypothetical protein [Prosthecobacter sp.]|jgi:hypothetical protein|uniref:hypothetical protein n=1 Tax=Prosthecobacter sp. TaxID=1965333 RepID=UPI0037C6BEFB
MHPIYSSRFDDIEQECRESVIRAVKKWRALGWVYSRQIYNTRIPDEMVAAIDANRFHSGYSLTCCMHHALLIIRHGWRSYVAMSRAQYKRSQKLRR